MDIKRIVCLILSLSLMVSGCSVFRPHTEEVTVTTDHQAAEIFINGNLEGRGTAYAKVKRDHDALVIVRAPGYEIVEYPIVSSENTTGLLDFIGGCMMLFPFLGQLAPGSKSLEQTDIYIPLQKTT